MPSVGRRRGWLVVACSLTYPLVWAGAAVIAFVAGVTSSVETDTKGLGDAIFGFAVGALALSLLWAVVVLARTKRHGRPVRAGLVAFGVPTAVIAGLFVSAPLGVGLALALPAVGSWWSTAPPGDRTASPRAASRALLG